MIRSRSFENIQSTEPDRAPGLQRSHSDTYLEEKKHAAPAPPVEAPPPALALSRQPSHTLPDAPALSESPFEGMMAILKGMGFSYDEAEVALVYTGSNSVEDAVDFILRNPDAIYHAFRAKEEVPGAEPESEIRIEVPRIYQEDAAAAALMAASKDLVCATCGLQRVFHLIDVEHARIVPSEDEKHQADRHWSAVLDRVQPQPQPQHNFPELMAYMDHELDIVAPPPGPELVQEGPYKGMTLAVAKALQEAEEEEKARVQRREEAAARGEELISCMICFDEFSQVDMCGGKLCPHLYCRLCMTEHFRVNVSDANVLHIKCPDPGCGRNMEEKEILDLISGNQGLVEKYHKFKRNALIARNPNARWCPTPECDTVMEGSSFQPRLECPKCHKAICFNCNQPWHGRQKCEEVLDEQYSDWARGKDVQTCPQCRVRIEKDLGCNHMTCFSCKYEFCWLCRGRYYSGHFAPYNPFGCPGAQFVFEGPDAYRPGIIARNLWRLLVFAGLCVGFALAVAGAAIVLALAVVGIIPFICYKLYRYYRPAVLLNRRGRRRHLED